MAKQLHDRVPDQTLIESSVPHQLNSHACNFTLSIWLWTKNSNGSPRIMPQPGASILPISCLAFDLLTASGGQLDTTQGPMLLARYPDILSAVLSARRLRWAIQGFAENDSCHGTAASILIHGAENNSTTSALDNIAPGQILVSLAIAEEIYQLPGLQLGETDKSEWRELLWSTPDTESAYVTDEQELSRLIRQLGRVDPGPPRPKVQVPSPPVEPVATEAPMIPEQTPPDDLIHTRPERPSAPPASRRPWLIWGGAAAVVAIAAVLLVASFHRKAAVNPDAVTTPVTAAAVKGPDTTSKPSASGLTLANSAHPRHPNPAGIQNVESPVKPGTANPETARLETARPDPRTSKPVASGSCELNEGEIPRSLDRAKNYMHQGKLYDAQSAFQRVLGCPSAHEEAQSGLNEVKRKLELQGLPPTPE